ncbi:hypothetical protein U9M48_016875 [Paspalum notatum var. saurae]|uniref:Membrane-associated 30 kDa protein n=1 Tax=Paspalum notatum var. saurae TaxID=547442 RepID=A0AAQ3T8C8_PASNO
MHAPREPHRALIKRILRFVRGTLSSGLHIGTGSVNTPIAYSTRRRGGLSGLSTIHLRLRVYLGDNLVSWSSKRRTTVSRSGARREYRAVAHVVAECCWLRRLLRELHIRLPSATVVFCDNVSAVYMTANPVHHKRTKHIEIDIHFVREKVALGEIRVLHVPSSHQFADIMTKGLPTALFREFRSSLCVREPPASTAGGFSLRVVQVRQSNLTRFKCNANLFDRLTRVVRSYANAVLSTFEDPEKILDQAVLEMNDDLTKMRQATAQVLASQKRLENKYKAADQASADWYRRAQLALQKGDEDLAREALKRRKSYADNASSLKAQLDQQKGVVENLISNTKLLESKIAEAKQKKDTLKARAQSAKTATKVSEMLGNVNTSSALSAFEKMEEKVMAMESQAEALGQLATDDLEGKFALLETSSVDDDLAQMKKELSGSSLKGELPPGRTAVSSSGAARPFPDLEIENELNELRRKAKEY